MRCSVVGSIVCMGAATLCAAEVPAGQSVVKSNADFTVTWNAGDGTLSSLVLNGDADRMNWIEGTAGWGQVRLVAQSPGRAFQNSTAFLFKGMRQEGEWVVSSYEMEKWESPEW